jgi:hypothetical protein
MALSHRNTEVGDFIYSHRDLKTGVVTEKNNTGICIKFDNLTRYLTHKNNVYYELESKESRNDFEKILNRLDG